MSCQLHNSHFPPDKEKQISVDPVSVEQLAKVGDHLSVSPPTLPPFGKPKFISCSLPSSAFSSPQSGSAAAKSFKKWKIPAQNQHSTTLSRVTLQQEMALRRSKSCGEGRSCTPSDEFDILSRRASMKLPENGVHVLYDCTNDAGDYEDSEELDPGAEKNFKCGALCLFLPGFSKKKLVQASQDERGDQGSVGSRAVSLEKFECGSWYSAAILDVDDEDDGADQSYFDLPLELIRSGADHADSPVKTAFVSDRDRKGVLKKCTSNLAPRRSHEASNRHVRFSTSTPTSYPTSPTSACITPRLRKAREEFNAFLEAQST
ncbi:uncharacterized protein [Elaeis guineensis]|uniref:uncharacterized protein n=1 Tax=Elaeis guineensis var. tenera TaxID=51953 RepID=UPI000579D868